VDDILGHGGDMDGASDIVRGIAQTESDAFALVLEGVRNL
jgi:hypothetical protein